MKWQEDGPLLRQAAKEAESFAVQRGIPNMFFFWYRHECNGLVKTQMSLNVFQLMFNKPIKAGFEKNSKKIKIENLI